MGYILGDGTPPPPCCVHFEKNNIQITFIVLRPNKKKKDEDVVEKN